MSGRQFGHHYAQIEARDGTAIHAGDNYSSTRQIFMLDHQLPNLETLKQQLALSKQRMKEVQEQVTTLEVIIAALENLPDPRKKQSSDFNDVAHDRPLPSEVPQEPINSIQRKTVEQIEHSQKPTNSVQGRTVERIEHSDAIRQCDIIADADSDHQTLVQPTIIAQSIPPSIAKMLEIKEMTITFTIGYLEPGCFVITFQASHDKDICDLRPNYFARHSERPRFATNFEDGSYSTMQISQDIRESYIPLVIYLKPWFLWKYTSGRLTDNLTLRRDLKECRTGYTYTLLHKQEYVVVPKPPA